MTGTDLDNWINGLIAVALIAFVTTASFIVADLITGHVVPMPAEVVERAYRPASTSIGYATNTSGDGGSSLVVTSESEAYKLIVKADGRVWSQTVSAGEYAAAQPGSVVMLRRRAGGMTGWLY